MANGAGHEEAHEDDYIDSLPPDPYDDDPDSHDQRPSVLPPDGHDVASDDRPVVNVGGQMAPVVARVAELLKLDPNLFTRNKELVRVIGAEAPDEGKEPDATESMPVIRPVHAHFLLPHLSSRVRFVRRKALTKVDEKVLRNGGKVKEELVDAHPPSWLVNGLISKGSWPLRHLTGISETPLMREDGTILQTPGYDESTGYLYRPACDFPTIPEFPTQDDARAALAELMHVFCDFPYADEASRMVPIAAICTILARSAIDSCVPAFMFDASTRGSGKTLQCDCISAITLGRDAARKSYPPTEEELGKVIAGYALSGARLILLDNIDREFGGGELEPVLTARRTIEIRILGKSECPRLSWAAVLMGSGNNVIMKDDTARRTLVARLETKLENPEERTGFVHKNLFKYCIENRPRLVAAALTMLRAWSRFGEGREHPWGSFESWSNLIPEAIRFAGGTDPMLAKPQRENTANDDTRAHWTFVETFPDLCRRKGAGEEGMTCREILRALYPEQTSDAARSLDGLDDLREAIETWTHPKPGQTPSIVSLGKKLGRVVGRNISGRKVVRVVAKDRNATVRWNVQIA